MSDILFKQSGEVIRNPEKQVRPLGGFSNFIVEEAPILFAKARLSLYPSDAPEYVDAIENLNQLYRGIDQNAYEFLTNSEVNFDPNSEDSRIARLDVMIANRMLRLSGGLIGENLSKLVQIYTPEGYVAETSYADLILENPDGDMRTLSGDNREADFYRAHREIEVPLHNFASKIFTLVQNGNIGGEDYQNIYDEQALDTLVTQMVGLYKNLTGFNEVIRPSLMSIPNYEFKGPSGFDSATIYTLDLLSSGNQITDYAEFRDCLEKNFAYFSPHHKDLIRGAIQLADNNISLKSMADGGNHNALQLRNLIVGQLKAFRRAHINAIRTHIPGAMQGATDGTGGVPASDLARFLRSRENMHPDF